MKYYSNASVPEAPRLDTTLSYASCKFFLTKYSFQGYGIHVNANHMYVSCFVLGFTFPPA